MMATPAYGVEDAAAATRRRNVLVCALLLLTAWTAGVLALLGGQTGGVLLLVSILAVGLIAFIFWRPVIGLYAAVLLDIAMDPYVPGDTISKYTDLYHLDLNTVVHAGIAFNPGELLLIVTTLACLLRAAAGTFRLRGGPLGRPVLVFGVFLVAGYIWGLANHGDAKIGLFEVRGPFMLVMLYFLVTNLIEDERQLRRLLALMVTGGGILAIWTVLRLVIVFHRHGGGPDSAFSVNHDDALFFAILIVLCLARFCLGATRRQWLVALSALVLPATVALFVMQRRAAFSCLFFGVVIALIALYLHRRRLFMRLVPTLVLLLLAYTAIFWNSSGTLAQPIRAFKSGTTTSSLSARDQESNQYRLDEKADVRETIMLSPLTGVGFGRPYLDTHPLVDMTSWWPFQFYTPHIEVFWIWLKVGAIGFIAFWVVICLALQRAGDVIRRGAGTAIGFAGLAAATYIVMLLIYAYVDIGLFSARCEVLLGVMVGIAGTAHRFLEEARTVLPSARPLYRRAA